MTPNEYSFDFSLAGNVSGGLQQRAALGEMPAFAEYYVDDAKVLLKGGQPQMVDSIKGMTRGQQLTYFSNSDKLLVEGAQNQPVESRILKR